MKKILHLILILGSCSLLQAQRIIGKVPVPKGTEVTLMLSQGLAQKEFAKTTTDEAGNFTLSYPKNYTGAGLVSLKEQSGLLVLLNGSEDIQFTWGNLQDFSTLVFSQSPENIAFGKGITINTDIAKKMAGLTYLLPLYSEDKDKQQWISTQITAENNRFPAFLEQLPNKSYAKEYMQWRRQVELMLKAMEKPEADTPKKMYELYSTLPLANANFWNSGLLTQVLQVYYAQTDKTSAEYLRKGTDHWLTALASSPEKMQDVAEHVFKQLEQQNLQQEAEYIALKMLGNNSCKLTDKQIDYFEQYRALGIGKTAPDIVFESQAKSQNLKSLPNPYKLVVFGASTCPHCQTDYPSLVGKYKSLKETYHLEIVYVSIDTDKKAFTDYYKEAPFITYCDAKGWETQAAKDYHVMATPTYILLDKDLKILAKINTPEHLQAWLENDKAK